MVPPVRTAIRVYAVLVLEASLDPQEGLAAGGIDVHPAAAVRTTPFGAVYAAHMTSDSIQKVDCQAPLVCHPPRRM
jgi:hypothetical protein